MTANKSDRNVFLVMDKLNEYIHFFEIDSPYFNIHPFYFDQLISLIDELDTSRIRKDKTVIVASLDLIDSGILEEIKNVLSNKFKSEIQNIIYLIREETMYFEKDRWLSNERYVYFLSDPERFDIKSHTYNFILYINIVLQLIKEKERVDEYIIDSIKRSVDTEIFKKQKLEIEKLNCILKELSRTDYLTKILNRRAFFEELEKERKQTARSVWRIMKDNELRNRYRLPSDNLKRRDFINCEPSGTFFDHFGKFSCLLIDIDFFKRINDTKGHIIGDQVLKRLGEMLLSGLIRETDIAGRYGGEEFIVLLTETGSKYARIVAERLKDKIKAETFYDSDGNAFNITVSIGISEFKISDNSSEDIIKRSDQALYYAKDHGRDKIVDYDEICADQKKGH